MTRPARRLHGFLAHLLPEQRVFLRSGDQTRFLRLSPARQALAIVGTALILGWTIVASAIVLMETITAGSLRDQALRDRQLVEERLDALGAERDRRAAEAVAAQDRFNAALAHVAQMQGRLLDLEDRRRELQTGIGAVQDSLRRVTAERDAALAELALLRGEGAPPDRPPLADVETTLALVNAALETAAAERDGALDTAAEAHRRAETLALDYDLMMERNSRIFGQLEEALTVSVEPLEKMFRAAGLSPDRLIESVRRGYSGQGGPLTPISFSTSGLPPSAEELRANAILAGLDELAMYRIAADKVPLALPVRGSYRFTSGFGMRWGRMHEGADFAGAPGTAIHATADGVVASAGWQNGYGQVIVIRHAYGLETRYAHLSRMRVKPGQKVSKGDRIGDMGNTGRSTGTHLHYEVRIDGKPVNPMTLIKAARNVF